MRTGAKLSLLILISFLPLPLAESYPRHGISGRAGLDKGKRGNVHLWTIHSTSPQEELCSKFQGAEGVMKHLQARFLPGPSTAFLVRGEELHRAVAGALHVFVAGESADVAALWTENVKTDHYWLVVYLGHNAKGPGWLLKYVEVTKDRVRFCYAHKKERDTTIRHYVYYVPVGKFDPSFVTLELFDEDLEEVTFSRRVRTTGP